MEHQLKPCPLCNGVAELKQAHYMETDLPYSYVHCTNTSCTLHHETRHFSGGSEERNSEEAVNAWNQQADVSTVQA